MLVNLVCNPASPTIRLSNGGIVATFNASSVCSEIGIHVDKLFYKVRFRWGSSEKTKLPLNLARHASYVLPGFTGIGRQSEAHTW
jgi:hypothetical protein